MFPSHVFSNHKPPILVMTTLSKHFLYSIILSKTCGSRNFDGFTMKNGSFKTHVMRHLNHFSSVQNPHREANISKLSLIIYLPDNIFRKVSGFHIVHAIRGMLVQRKTETGERCREKRGRKTKCLWLKFFVKWVDFGIFGAYD